MIELPSDAKSASEETINYLISTGVLYKNEGRIYVNESFMKKREER